MKNTFLLTAVFLMHLNFTDDATIANAIQVAGRKPISDGALTASEGNHYFTNVSEHAISKLDVNGNLSNIIQDKRLLWPDNLLRQGNYTVSETFYFTFIHFYFFVMY